MCESLNAKDTSDGSAAWLIVRRHGLAWSLPEEAILRRAEPAQRQIDCPDGLPGKWCLWSTLDGRRCQSYAPTPSRYTGSAAASSLQPRPLCIRRKILAQAFAFEIDSNGRGALGHISSNGVIRATPMPSCFRERLGVEDDCKVKTKASVEHRARIKIDQEQSDAIVQDLTSRRAIGHPKIGSRARKLIGSSGTPAVALDDGEAAELPVIEQAISVLGGSSERGASGGKARCLGATPLSYMRISYMRTACSTSAGTKSRTRLRRCPNCGHSANIGGEANIGRRAPSNLYSAWTGCPTAHRHRKASGGSPLTAARGVLGCCMRLPRSSAACRSEALTQAA